MVLGMVEESVGRRQVVNLLQPPTVKAVAALCVVRNSIGENSYVADEVITAKSGGYVSRIRTKTVT